MYNPETRADGNGTSTLRGRANSASPQRKKALPQNARGPQIGMEILPVQLERELELARIVGSCRLPGVGPEHVDRGDVDAVGNVEHVDDQVGVESFTEIDALGNPHVGEGDPRG